MADINEIKGAVRNTLETVVGKTRDIAEKAADKAKDVARITKLNMELNSEKNTMEKAYTEIGKLYYETRKDSPDSFFVQLCDEISLSKENIEKLQAEIASLKARDCKADGGSIEVEFTELSEEEFEKPEAPKSEGCSCGCSEHAKED